MIPSHIPDGGFDVIALVRGQERYVWLYTPDKLVDLFSSMNTFAALPCYSFTWIDAQFLRSQVMAQMEKKAGLRK